MLNDKTILITGGTGSFGKKMTKTILERYTPKQLIIYSRDELKQFEMSQRFSERKYPLKYVIGDVRDKERLTRACSGMNYVIHAAALKQVPAAEYNPTEAIKTNVLGAMNVIEAALTTGVQKVVALSTDKACNPINLYGATKLCSDKLFTASDTSERGIGNPVFSVVRYGNVVGSRGSVIPFFQERSKTGVLPITDSRMTRFWITLDQGVNFVLKVLEDGKGGEIFVPKIPSMKITDLAHAIAPQCRQEIVGIRPGEKVHEQLISKNDAHTTWEFDTHYVILPQRLASAREKEYQGVKKCAEGFEYDSGTNPWVADVELLKKMVAETSAEYADETMHWSVDEVPR